MVAILICPKGSRWAAEVEGGGWISRKNTALHSFHHTKNSFTWHRPSCINSAEMFLYYGQISSYLLSAQYQITILYSVCLSVAPSMTRQQLQVQWPEVNRDLSAWEQLSCTHQGCLVPSNPSASAASPRLSRKGQMLQSCVGHKTVLWNSHTAGKSPDLGEDRSTAGRRET